MVRLVLQIVQTQESKLSSSNNVKGIADSIPPFQHLRFFPSLFHVCAWKARREPSLFRHQECLQKVLVKIKSMEPSDWPRVSTPRVVDLPLSTLPTTAHRTSGVKETLGGGNRSSNMARGCTPCLDSNSSDAYCHFQKYIHSTSIEPTLPPTSSVSLSINSRISSTFSRVLSVPIQSCVAFIGSSENSTAWGGCAPIWKTYSPCCCVSNSAIMSLAVECSRFFDNMQFWNMGKGWSFSKFGRWVNVHTSILSSSSSNEVRTALTPATDFDEIRLSSALCLACVTAAGFWSTVSFAFSIGDVAILALCFAISRLWISSISAWNVLRVDIEKERLCYWVQVLRQFRIERLDWLSQWNPIQWRMTSTVFGKSSPQASILPFRSTRLDLSDRQSSERLFSCNTLVIALLQGAGNS